MCYRTEAEAVEVCEAANARGPFRWIVAEWAADNPFAPPIGWTVVRENPCARVR